MTQQKIILHHLQNKGSITTLQAARLYAITRLPNRVSELRDKGIDIKHVEHESADDGAAGNYNEYYLE